MLFTLFSSEPCTSTRPVRSCSDTTSLKRLTWGLRSIRQERGHNNSQVLSVGVEVEGVGCGLAGVGMLMPQGRHQLDLGPVPAQLGAGQV